MNKQLHQNGNVAKKVYKKSQAGESLLGDVCNQNKQP